MPWHVYIAECNDGKLYIGISQNVEERIKQHNKRRGCRFTKFRVPLKLLFQRCFDTKSEARRYELKLKGFSRKKKIDIITNNDYVLPVLIEPSGSQFF